MFIRCRKLNILLVFVTESYFSVSKEVRLNSTHCLIMKIDNKVELQNVARNHSADVDYILRRFTENVKKYSFLTMDITLSASDPLTFIKNLLMPL